VHLARLGESIVAALAEWHRAQPDALGPARGALFARSVKSVAHAGSLAHQMMRKSKRINSALQNAMDLLRLVHAC